MLGVSFISGFSFGVSKMVPRLFSNSGTAGDSFAAELCFLGGMVVVAVAGASGAVWIVFRYLRKPGVIRLVSRSGF